METAQSEKYIFTSRRVKVPTVIQVEMAECGAACLGMILAYYKKYISLEELRIMCNVTRDGSNAENILQAAGSYGLEGKGFSKDYISLDETSLPSILFWNFEHFVVLEGFKKDQIYINDPATGRRTLSFEEFDHSYSGIVLTFTKSPSFQPSGKPDNMIPDIIEWVKIIPFPLLFTFLSGLALIVPGLALPAFSQVFIDQVIMNTSLDWFWGITLGLLTTVLITIILAYWEQTILFRSYIKLAVFFSSKTFWHMLKLPFAFYTQRFPGEIAYRLTANESVGAAIATKIVPIAINGILIVFYGLTMLYYDPIVAIVGFCIMALNLFALRTVYQAKSDAYTRYQADSGKSISFSLGILGNIGNIKEMGMEYKLFPTWAGHYTKVQNAFLTIEQKNILLEIFPSLFNVLSITAVLGIGSWRVISGTLTVGMLVALQILMRNLLNPVMQLVNLSETIQFLKVDLSRLHDINRFPTEKKYENNVSIRVEKKLKGYLEVDNLCFSYGPLSENIIKNVYFELSPGKSVALVGPTGSGKSTIAKLISGLYPPRSGAIRFDGKERNEISQITLTNSLAVVEQFPFLFRGTVKDNISILDPSIEHDSIINAAKDACINDLILSRKGGYDFIVEQGGLNLSGGERQCFEIARALARNPSLLILDEATSTLDSEVEFEIITHIKRRGIALLLIAHRLSTIKTCDEIIVLDYGRIVAKGTHEELKNVPGIYQNLILSETDDWVEST